MKIEKQKGKLYYIDKDGNAMAWDKKTHRKSIVEKNAVDRDESRIYWIDQDGKVKSKKRKGA